jgi:DNA-binding protein HU-beta
MNKALLASKIADKMSIPRKDAEQFIETFEEMVTQSLVNQEEVVIAGFGTFSAKVRKGRVGVNPQKPSEAITIPPVFVPKFKAGKSLKDTLKTAGRTRGIGHAQNVSAPTTPQI